MINDKYNNVKTENDLRDCMLNIYENPLLTIKEKISEIKILQESYEDNQLTAEQLLNREFAKEVQKKMAKMFVKSLMNYYHEKKTIKQLFE